MKLYECILSLFGGIAIFLTAMNMMSLNLQKLVGTDLKLLLTKRSGNNLICVGIGTIIAMVIQSSAAVSVMSIGFANADILNLSQAAAVIIGANFGGSIIGILASLESLNIHVYFSFVSFIGVVFTFFKKDKAKIIGQLLCGLGMIFVGLNLLKESCDNDSFKDALKSVFEKIDFPLALVLIGFIFTSLIQSSSAMTGLVIVMIQGGAMDMKNGIFIILGSNIGTSTTALINTIGKNINAKRTGIIHLSFKIFGTFIFTVITWIFDDEIINILEKMDKKPSMQLAWYNVFFKFVSSVVSLPLIKVFILIATKILKSENDKNKKKQWKKAFNHINKRFLKVPSIAEGQIKKEIKDIIDLTKNNMEINIKELLEQNNQYSEEINLRNEMINYLNYEAIKFIVKLSQVLKENISDEITNNFSLFNHIIRVNKYIEEITEINKLMKKRGVKFNENAKANIYNMSELIFKLFDSAKNYIDYKKENKKGEYLILSEKIKFLENKLFQENYDEIINGKTSVFLGFYFNSVITLFVNISVNLDKIISLLKLEIINYKNKSFQHEKDNMLLVNNKRERKLISFSRYEIPSESCYIKDINISEKLNQSIN